MEYKFRCNNCDMDYNFLALICVDLDRRSGNINEMLFISALTDVSGTILRQFIRMDSARNF
jgi:hypothetical protein